MTGHSRSQNGVASLAYVPAIHVFAPWAEQDVDARIELTLGPANGRTRVPAHDA